MFEQFHDEFKRFLRFEQVLIGHKFVNLNRALIYSAFYLQQIEVGLLHDQVARVIQNRGQQIEVKHRLN